MARVLFLTQVLPYPLNAGPKVRAYHMLRHLAQRHQVILVSFVRPDDQPAWIEHLRTQCHRVVAIPMRRSLWRNLRAGVKGVVTGLPMVVARDEIGQMNATLLRLCQENDFDVVHADQLSMAGYGQLAARGRRAHTLLDEHNAIYLLTKRMAATSHNSLLFRMAAWREARAFARYEANMLRVYDAVLTVTQEDRCYLMELFPEAQRAALADKFTAVPICVDPQQVAVVSHRPRDDHQAPTILHMGTMFWPPNVSGVLWFAREVLPRIHQHLPAARFVVIGKSPPPEVQALAADPRIEITGYVADPQPYLAAADAFIVPLHAGGGMRVKILDAWLWGLPVVSTPMGAEGIEIRPEENILIGHDAATFADVTLRLLTDDALNQRLRMSGRSWVEQKYDWRQVYRTVDQVYEKLLHSQSK